jgi:hypothetical protein
MNISACNNRNGHDWRNGTCINCDQTVATVKAKATQIVNRLEEAYRWVITRDRIADLDAPVGTNSNAQGLAGPFDADDGVTTNPTRFAMYDDDGECYYEGMLYGDFCGFEPLDDFGAPNAGCTAIKIDGEWL